MAEADLREEAGAVRVPTLVVAGADPRSPLPVARELVTLIPGARTVLLPGLGHECFLESPDAFAAAVREFLLDQREPGPAARP